MPLMKHRPLQATYNKEITPALPYTRPRTKERFFRKHEYVYDEHFDCYLCPSGEVLTYSTTNKEGYREYKSPKHKCKTCSFLSQCTESKDHQKVGDTPYLARKYGRSRSSASSSRCKTYLCETQGND
ncbi:transposase [Peribacillus muralis]|uniref:transposase n=1 Tax=Peribacillus muralis TaxID=264697 RepID=UPI0035A3C587